MGFKNSILKHVLPLLLLIPSASADGPSIDLPKSPPSDPSGETSLTKQYPALGNYVFDEPASRVLIGFGIGPFGIIRNNMAFSANLFQFHWVNPWLDWEVFSVSYAMTLNTSDPTASKQFTFRTIPKYRINSTFSIGPLLGYELVTFPNLGSQIYNGTLATPQESFSSRGLVYGGAVSETFPLNKDLKIKLNELVYQETYSTTNAPENGWSYRYSTPGLNQNQGPINPGTVFLLEFSILY
jgi:hypothetical protein